MHTCKNFSEIQAAGSTFHDWNIFPSEPTVGEWNKAALKAKRINKE